MTIARRLRFSQPWRNCKAEKLEGTSRGLDADGISFPPPSLPPSPVIALSTFHPFTSISSFFLHVSLARMYGLLPTLPCFPHCPAKMTASCRRLRGPNTLGRHCLQSWRGRVPQVPSGGCAYAHFIIFTLSLNPSVKASHFLKISFKKC